MFKNFCITLVVMLVNIPIGTAGTIATNNGVWSPSTCGTEPEVPTIDSSSPDAYNQSIELIDDWQTKANAYATCAVSEANADIALIAKIANDTQARLRTAIKNITKDVADAKAKLENP